MSICQKCAGDGLIGNGPSPWLREGHVTTCDKCGGTGNLPDNVDIQECKICGTKWTADEILPCPNQENHTGSTEIAPTPELSTVKVHENKLGGILNLFRR